MMKVLVTGSSGQLGRAIQRLGISTAHQFTYLDKFQLDITSENQVLETFKAGAFDYCINCAAYTDVEGAEKEPEKAYELNHEAVINLAEAAKKYQTVLIHISTDYVFDGRTITSYTENDTPNPINVYGASKFEGEKAVQSILSKYFIIRTSWLYSQTGKNFYTTILRKAKEDGIIRVTDAQKGCPTLSDNLASFIIDLIERRNENYGIYHFTDGTPMTWYDFARNILETNQLLSSTKLIKEDPVVRLAKRPENSILTTVREPLH